MEAEVNLTPEELKILGQTFPEHEPLEPVDELEALRMERIAEYEAAALANPDPWRASLGSISAGLMRTASALGAAIEAEFRAGIDSPHDFQKLLQSVNTNLKVTRQIQELERASGKDPA